MNDDQKRIFAPDVVNVEEFAKRMMCSKSLIYELIQSNVLIEGEHYFRLGKNRGVRFPWSHELVKKMMTMRRKTNDKPKDGPNKTVKASERTTDEAQKHPQPSKFRNGRSRVRSE